MSAGTSRSRESWRVACHAHDPIRRSIEASKIKANELDQPIRPEVTQAAGGSEPPNRQLMDKRLYRRHIKRFIYYYNRRVGDLLM